jgi:hypothetical protein
MIGPTACDYGTYSGGSSDGYAAGGQAESSSGDNVVPVGNSSPSTEESRRDRWQNRYVSNGGNNDGDGDGGGGGGDNEQPAATATTAPAAEPTDPAAPVGNEAPTAEPTAPGTEAPTGSASATAAPGDANGFDAVPPLDGGEKGANNGLDVLGRDCTNSGLPPHTGFQEAEAQCVETAMGAVANESELPSLLITSAPEKVNVGEGFQLEVSTRNLVRDRFLGAAAGGYYLEASFLNEDGLQRGHFHTACRFLPSTTEAPDSSGAPAFFVATQDGGGGAEADTVTIDVPAANIKQAGELQCTSWAGDGSHRTPMMSRANQTPAIDSVRITVGGNGQAAAPAENGNAAGGAAQSQVPQPAEGAQGQEGADATAENNGAGNGAGSGAENEGGNNGAGESAEATSAETSEAEVAEVANNDTDEAAASTAGAGSNN